MYKINTDPMMHSSGYMEELGNAIGYMNYIPNGYLKKKAKNRTREKVVKKI